MIIAGLRKRWFLAVGRPFLEILPDLADQPFADQPFAGQLRRGQRLLIHIPL